MAEEHHKKSGYEYETADVVDDQQVGVEKTDRGLFGFGRGKKEEEKHQEEVIVSEFDEKVKVPEYDQPKVENQEYGKEKEKEEKKHETLSEKLHRSNSSSSSSDEEEGEGEEKKKKRKEKKGLKADKIKDIIGGEKEEEKYEDTNVTVEKYEEEGVVHPTEKPHVQPEEKKGFVDKIKDKLPGQQKKTEDVLSPPPPPHSHAEYEVAHEEKKGFVDKIKDKLPGQQKKTEDVPPPPPPSSHAKYEAAHEAVPSHQEGDQAAKEKKGLLEKIKEKLPGYHPKTEEEKDQKEKDKESVASHY